MAATLYSPSDLIPGKLAAIDAAFASAATKRASQSREQALTDYIAHHKAAMARVLSAHKSRRKWLAKVSADNPGVSRFYPLDPHGTLASAKRHRKEINRARAELSALRAAEKVAA
jgi:hypothetical protein